MKLVLLTIGTLVTLSCGWCFPRGESEKKPQELLIFHAGSLAVPFRELSALFEKEYPGVVVKAEAAGSRDGARKISDLKRRCDVFGSADYQVIEDLLMPEHADFEIRFATNEMVIAYTDASFLSGRLNRDNWYQILLDKRVNFGRSDPNSDPCGYRTVLVFRLAEKHYQVSGLANQLEEKHGKRFVRPKETDLLALLEAAEIDYLFIYRSVAQQHGLKIITLPDEVNLKSTQLADWYRTVTVKITGKKPGEFLTLTGAPIVYSVTIPKKAQNRELAEAYVAWLLSEVGQAVMEKNGQPAIHPAQARGYDRLPARLKPYTEEFSNGNAGFVKSLRSSSTGVAQ